MNLHNIDDVTYADGLRSRAPLARTVVVSAILAFSTAALHAIQTPLADNSASPHAAVRGVGLDEARWTTGFWADRFTLCRDTILPSMGRLMEGTNYSQFFRNFEIAAGLAEGRSRGASFNDGEMYKLMEAAIATYALTGDDYYRRNLERAIDVIAKAQRPDGYIHTPVLIRQRQGDTNAVPFQDKNNFEMYNMGHLMTSACLHHRVTGQTNFLVVARKAADFLYETFHNAPPQVARSSVCSSHFMGIVELYRTTRDPRYLELARKFFQARSEIKDGGDDNQDRIPFIKQTTAVGHAVRANYLYAGAADLFMETGDLNFWKPLGSIWTNMVRQKMYITGGCGALYDGSSPDASKDQKNISRTHQAYGRNYQLPNITAHNETCANIGNVLWNWRMFLATGEGRFIDVAELALYNSVLSGVALDGTNFFYTNPLRLTDPLPTELRWSRTRVPFVGSFCCPPNVARMMAESSDYAYAKSTNTIWVNLYGGSTLATDLIGGGRVRLTQETGFPWSGGVRITVNECPTNAFALKLRIPGWSKGASVRLNQKPWPQNSSGGVTSAVAGFLEIRRTWQPGDIVDLDLPMPVRLMEANPLVEETLNQVAVQRGPIVYCLESTDLPKGVRMQDVFIPENIRLSARFDPRLLGGVVVVEGSAQARPSNAWNNELYRDFHPAESKPVRLQLIPYCVWQNRGPCEMTVWMPLAGK